jgi:hypothetical protein
MEAETEQPRWDLFFFFLLHARKNIPLLSLLLLLHGCDRVEFRQVQAAQTCAFLNRDEARKKFRGG